MKTRLCLVLGITAVLGLLSCEEDKIISNTQLIKSVNVTSQDFQDGDAGTRATYTVDDGGFHFTWSAGDTVGIYPVGGDQVAFPISSGEGSKTAQFDGGAWALRSSYSYAAYYPFSSVNYHVDETSVPVSYIGQSQNGNGSLDCLDRYDYQASVATRPDAEGNVNIELKHLGCFVRFQLSMPVPDTYTSVTLKSNKTNLITSGSFDLSQGNITLTPQGTAQSISISLNNDSTTAENKVLTVYCMMAPSDLSNSEISITVEGTLYKSYTATVSGKKMLAGKAYGYTAKVQSGTNINGSDVEWDDEGQDTSPTANIIFADENVKALCVSNWDTDGDGNLSIAEAAAVTNIGNVFRSKKIKSFKELRFFTGLTAIASDAFCYCSDLTSIVIPNAVTSIGEYAFERCSGLISVVIPDRVTKIGEGAFYECSSLTSIEIPSSVTNIELDILGQCSGLESIIVASDNKVYDSRNNCNAIIHKSDNTIIAGCKNTIIPNSVSTIGYCAFEGATGLASIEIPTSVTSIETGAFAGCSGLTSIEIPSSVTSIEEAAFVDCSGLTSIEIPSNVTLIGKGAFENCRGLTSIVFHEGCSASIERKAFEDCGSLTSIEFPKEGAISIGELAFIYCKGLDSIYFSDGVKSIGHAAFEDCYLTSIGISSGVTSIAEGAFYDGDELYSISVAEGNPVYDSRDNCNAIIETQSNTLIVGCNNTVIPNSVTSIGGYAFKSCVMTSIDIPNSVESIGDYAFQGGRFTSITIPESVKTIGDEAFSYKAYLTDVYCYAKNIPETGRDVFDDLDLPVTLHVPEEAIELYKATEPWKNFDAIVPLSTSDSNPQYEYVDLGLSVNWATFNVGATKPEEYGDYFAWGETEPYYEAGYAQVNPQTHWKNGKSYGYVSLAYKWYNNGSEREMTKYCNNSNYGNNGFTDAKTTLDLEDDVAHIKWGSNWRMPTKAEQNELRNNCIWTWYSSGNSEFGGVAGYKVTSNKDGYNDRFIFLPAAGHRNDTYLTYVGSDGIYWSSSLNTNNPRGACYLDFNSSSVGWRSSFRSNGSSVRPVYPSDTWEKTISVKLEPESVTLHVGESVSLAATVMKGNDVVSYPVTWTSDSHEFASVDDNGVVTAKAIGKANINASIYGKSATCIIEVTASSSGEYEYVDLGLSVKWATFNVGATKPEEYGDYFAWGETEIKTDYSLSTYKWCNGSSITFTKYCNKSNYGNDGFTDTKFTLDPEDDVAHVKWGGSWRMPTTAEQNELCNNCTWTWTTLNGVNGYLVTSNKVGYIDRFIFLPATGGRHNTYLYDVGAYGNYFSSSLESSREARCLSFGNSSHNTGYYFRYYGYSVRPVCP